MANNLTLTICICTSGRPDMLRRCLASIAAGKELPDAVLVSDDSRLEQDQRAIRDVCGEYPFVTYQVGPRRGLCANRNAVIAAARTTHVSLIDDDAVASFGFVQQTLKLIDASPSKIFSGDVLESGTILTPPTNPTRWGHFGAFVPRGEPLRNVNLNCNVFPLAAFADAAFDERLVYGYEDTDLCDRLVRAGWRIEHRPELRNSHFPPSRGSRDQLAERERFAVLLRMRGGRRFGGMMAMAWALPAACRAIVAYARRGRWSWLLQLPSWVLRGWWISQQSPIPAGLPVNASEGLQSLASLES